MIVNVSDLFDAMHDMVSIAHARFGLADDSEPSLSDFADQLEIDLFLPACARRVATIARRDVDPDEVGAMIRLRDQDGGIRAGAAGRYHSHGFDGHDEHGGVANEVLAANLLPRSRSEVELVVEVS